MLPTLDKFFKKTLWGRAVIECGEMRENAKEALNDREARFFLPFGGTFFSRAKGAKIFLPRPR